MSYISQTEKIKQAIELSGQPITCIIHAGNLDLTAFPMKCPHCNTAIHFTGLISRLYSTHEKRWTTIFNICPECEDLILYLQSESVEIAGQYKPNDDETLVYPKVRNRPLPPEVPEKYANDFQEACAVLPYSPKASAALSRRCLQHLLRDEAGASSNYLSKQIDEVLGQGLPSWLADSIDGIRNIGNFAAHPNKSESTGEIIEVEAGEAEWVLDTLELLFDHYIIKPKKVQQQRAGLNAKLEDGGSRPMK